MIYQFIEQHKRAFPVVVMCQVLGVSRSVASTLGASALPARATEKMLSSHKRSGRYFSRIEVDMGLHVSTLN
jgi:predicted protein tyrosine phosphatase